MTTNPLPRLPLGATDAHCHVFGPATSFPVAPGSTYVPEDRPVEALEALHGRHGLTRAVLVQPGCYGEDHSCMIAAMRRAPELYRGVATVSPQTPDTALTELHAAGMRSARFSFMPHLGGGPAREIWHGVADRIAPLGWHLSIHCNGESLLTLADDLAGMALPVVIDHMGRIDATAPDSDPARRALFELAALPHVWVKVSGADRVAPPEARDAAVSLAAELCAISPDRTLWGTDWPHPNSVWAMPEDDDLVALLPRIAQGAALAKLIVSNPERLYGWD